MQFQKNSLKLAVALLCLLMVLIFGGQAWAYRVVHRFTLKDGNQPWAGLVADAAGNFYGTTYWGGRYRWGSVFKLSPTPDGRWPESVIYSFGSDGINPCSPLILDDAGNLYGATFQGGAFGNGGTIFKLVPNPDGSWTHVLLYEFTDGVDGSAPESRLTFDSEGNLYGTASRGGLGYGNGTIFKLAPNPDGSWTYTLIYSFNNRSDGFSPIGGLVFDTAGNLYGTANGQGMYTHGTIYKLTPDGNGEWTFSTIHQFTGGDDGSNPVASLVFDQSGNLYGTTSDWQGIAVGNGAVFQLQPLPDGKWRYRTLHYFTGGWDGKQPFCDVVLDAAGNLYGTTRAGGDHGMGVVFKLIPTPEHPWKLEVLHHFWGGQDGNYPNAGLTWDGNGNLLGTTVYGGADNNRGVVFQLTP
ncbi:MAG: hypothetical protein LAN83_06345 [Acidobacteriia bacterium]|nr:hypothetical protein [Terriglobia bacterium]